MNKTGQKQAGILKGILILRFHLLIYHIHVAIIRIEFSIEKYQNAFTNLRE